ncbi:response regulator transcription factor [Psychrobium sp. 1_MG-2023]|uniref:response regulator transcription factor n=1 Tax=Psychrobium sp. 1_MG-2023 TaxID=3062624 RepID=UPI000C333631|nr:response regulator transcription factor [Psychrobium sp. 1_MG-2023]MDP2560558.1 response regulator transcription factor [Psychrobium sp. 1_MG-2023]PKF57633.1 DNA-binding response regulator [Alteromonadales bacterium alter-6D02]
MAAPHILIIEDDLSLNEQLSALLITKGYLVTQHHDGEQGLNAAISHNYSMVLLDVRLPIIDGFTVLQRLRQHSTVPVIMITACAAEQERIQGFSYGADDYLPKPFNITELILRIDALLRRANILEQPTPGTTLSVDEIKLYKDNARITFSDKPIEMTPIQFKLLWTLIENKNETLSKPYLSQVVLEKEFSQYDRSLDMHLSRVRKKLTSVGMPSTRIITSHGRGYRFE